MRHHIGVCVATILTAVTAVPSFSAKFHSFNHRPEQAELRVPSSPEVVVPFHTIVINVESPTGAFPYTAQLRASVEKELTGAFSIVTAGGEGALTISVLEFTPPTTRLYTAMETRYVQGNSNTQNNSSGAKKGWASVLNGLSTPPPQVPVQYWEAQGQLTLKSVMKDNNGSSVDEKILAAPFALRREIAVNNVATTDQMALPQQDAILKFLLLEGARKVRHRYAIGTEPLQVKLPIDQELEAGNRMAMEGNWESALSLWKTVSTNSNPGDQSFSMALGSYAMAFKALAETQDPEEASRQFKEADRLLADARQKDPKESYFRDIESRMAAAKLEIDKAAQQAKALALRRNRETESEHSIAASNGSKGFGSAPKEESPQAAEFRSYIRAQWKNRMQPPTEKDLGSLQEAGRLGWKLSAEESRWIVKNEADAWQERKSKQDLYLTQLQGFLKQGVLTADGRRELKKLSSNLGLSEDEIASIESRISFREERARPATRK